MPDFYDDENPICPNCGGSGRICDNCGNEIDACDCSEPDDIDCDECDGQERFNVGTKV